MNETTEHIAKQYHITDKLNDLTNALLTIPGIIDIEYDINGFLDDMRQVIIIPHYSLVRNAAKPETLTDYVKRMAELRNDILSTAKKYGLTHSGDAIEDYGEHFYIVFNHDNSWIIPDSKTTESISMAKTESDRSNKICDDTYISLIRLHGVIGIMHDIGLVISNNTKLPEDHAPVCSDLYIIQDKLIDIITNAFICLVDADDIRKDFDSEKFKNIIIKYIIHSNKNFNEKHMPKTLYDQLTKYVLDLPETI